MSEPTTTATAEDTPLVHAVNVTKSFHGTEVLKGIDMDVHRGEVVVLLGPSGSGKTTFLRCINQLETIAMVKDTSLLAAVPVIVELFYQSYQFGQRSFQIMPGIVAATIWYLIVCSILMVGQSRLERYYGRGFGAVPQRTQFKLTKIGADH